jgi:hypothetical protein
MYLKDCKGQLQIFFLSYIIIVMGPSTLLGDACAPLDQCFILRIFRNLFNMSFKKYYNFKKKI